jgi:hypothetical protein
MSELLEQVTQSKSIEEAMESLTGWDEIAIEKAFGEDITSLLVGKPTMSMRALVFVDKRREGMKDGEAKSFAMEMKLQDAQAWFEDDDEITPDEPVTVAGKDDSLPG